MELVVSEQIRLQVSNTRSSSVSDNIQQTSTITQFFIMDYGMENCSIILSIPTSSSSDSELSSLHIGNGGNAELDVWSLDWDRKLDYRRLSWNTKPRRVQHMGILYMAYGQSQQQLPGFQCSSGTYETIEVSCRGCDVELIITGNAAEGKCRYNYERRIETFSFQACS